MPSTSPPALIACAHGTDHPRGQAMISALRRRVQSVRPGVQVLEAYVDVQQPRLAEVLGRLPRVSRAVVVPLLLSAGYHVKVDIPRAAAAVPGPRIGLATPLGPDRRLAGLLAERLTQAGAGPEDQVVLAAAGSSDPGAIRDVEEMAGYLAEIREAPVSTGYGAKASPTVPEAVDQARQQGRAQRLEPEGPATAGTVKRVLLSSYLLAAGFFHDQLAEAGAELLAAPLLEGAELERVEPAVPGAHPQRVAENALSLLSTIVWERYDEVLSRGD